MTTELLKNAIEGYKKDIRELNKAYKPIAKISDANSKAMLQDLVIERVIELNKRIHEIENLIEKLDSSSTKNEVTEKDIYSIFKSPQVTDNQNRMQKSSSDGSQKIEDINSQNKELLDKDYVKTNESVGGKK